MISNPAYINKIGRSRGVDIREGSLYHNWESSIIAWEIVKISFKQDL